MNRAIIKIWVIIVFMGWSILVHGLNKEEKSAIMAIKTGDIELLKSYLDKHPDLNCEFSNGKTGLYYAIVYDQFKISEILLKRGADPNLIVSDCSTLKWAIKYNRGRIARLLIEYGADVNKPDKKLDTPLIYAAELDNLEICKILIDRGADPLQANLKEKRASGYAFHYDESLTYKYLLSMEKQYKSQDSIPSMQDGPYIYWEVDDQIVLTYYERNQDKNLTRLIEKTIETGKADTIVEGIGWDKNSYRIKHRYTPNAFNMTTAGNIFVIGDVHGRYHALVNLLINNKIIDSDLKWIFGEGQLVLLGDVFDRGDLVTETLWFLYELEIQAQNSGGNVHLLLGNHEIMALTGDDRYLNDKYNYFTQYTRIYYFQLFEKNTVLGSWLRSQNIIVRINDNLFMHAGISPQFAAYDYAYSDINFRVQNYLNSGQRDEDGSPEDIILGPIGPMWYRGYMNLNNSLPEVTQQFVDDYLNSKGLKRMILGHNDQLAINASYEGKIISADVEIDESGKSAQGLLISGDKIFRCFSDGTKERIE
jgi:hypothetical protein